MNSILDPDRLLGTDGAVRAVARGLYESVAKLPIISPHGHVDPSMLVKNEPFANPAELFIYFDHYVTRLLHAEGFALDQLGKPNLSGGNDSGVTSTNPRAAWGILCSNWHLFAGTSSGYWLTHEFATLFGIDQTPSAANADVLYDQISAQLAKPEMLPRALFAAIQHRAFGNHRRPLRRPRRPPGACRRPNFYRPRCANISPRPLSRPSRQQLGCQR